MNKQVLGRGAVYIYIQFIVSATSGYIFWLIMSRLTTSSFIGTLSVIIATTEILSSVAIIGMPDSIQRFLGKALHEQKIEDSKIYVLASLFFVAIGIVACSLFLFVGGSFFKAIDLDSSLNFAVILVVVSNSIQTILNSIVISSLKTQSLPLINILSSGIRIILSIILVIMGFGVFPIIVSYLLLPNLVSSVLLGFVTKTILKSGLKKENTKEKEKVVSFINASKQVLTAGLANWIPLLVTTVGYQLGTIIIFGFEGSGSTAIYFLTLNIVTAILLGTTALFTITLPALSSMHDARKRLAWQTIRWGSLISIPLSCSLIFYSKDIMGLFGETYVQGALALQILLLSVLPTIIAGGIGNLAFSYGNYKQSFVIDLAMSILRTILYFILIPIYGIVGGAISFASGSLLALVISLIIISKIRILIFWKDLIIIFIVPLVIGFLLYTLQVYFIIGIFLTILLSYVLLLLTKTIGSSDLEDFLGILPIRMSNQIIALLKKIRG